MKIREKIRKQAKRNRSNILFPISKLGGGGGTNKCFIIYEVRIVEKNCEKAVRERNGKGERGGVTCSGPKMGQFYNNRIIRIEGVCNRLYSAIKNCLIFKFPISFLVTEKFYK